jgi:phenylalanyl-tRNA synthetase beta chain
VHVSLEWIADFVDVPEVSELCTRLVAAGIEVEAVVDPKAQVHNVVVATVRSARPHPQAQRLQICEVFDGSATYGVVCGAPNVAAGMRVALARVGAQLPAAKGAPAPAPLTAATLRGVRSEGMLCARSELGLQDEVDGLWVLPEHFALGAEVLVEAAVPVTLELGITPNRPDLLCHLGVAREVAASTQRRTKPNKWRLTEKGPDVGTLGRVLVEDAAACRRYVARVVRGLKIGPSPAWLRSRLESIGQRSVNNVVDATNYVMHELGQPLHAFDLSRLAVEAGCPTVRVRRATAGEVLRTLDGVERQLTPGDLVIADPNRPVALAGVMGGADAEVRQGTSSVLLEAACFDPVAVRQGARRHGLRTEASQRFERGVDIGLLTKAVDRCAQLLADIADGEVAKGTLEVAQKIEPLREVPLRLARIARVLGVGVPTEAVVQLLEPLEIRCVNRTEAMLIFEVPSFRPDISREIDLIEEVARRHGYGRIPERLPDTSAEYAFLPVQTRPQAEARQALLSAGLHEAVCYGFGNPKHYAPYASREGEALLLLNPLGEDMRALRTTLAPGLLQVLQHNVRQGLPDGRFFEIGTTFHARAQVQLVDASDPESAEAAAQLQAAPPAGGPPALQPGVALPHEQLRAACVLMGARHPDRWYNGGAPVDASDIVGVAEAVIEAFAATGVVQRVNHPVPGYNPLCSAQLRIAKHVIGHLGQLDPQWAAAWDLSGPVFVLEVAIDALAAQARRDVRVHALPRLPKTRRDLAVVVPAGSAADAGALQRFIAAHAGGALGADIVERVWLFDRYTGAPLAPGEVSLAFAIDYRSRDRTLQEAEVAEAFAALSPQLTETFGVQIRSA